jgi:hypothetical protein
VDEFASEHEQHVERFMGGPRVVRILDRIDMKAILAGMGENGADGYLNDEYYIVIRCIDTIQLFTDFLPIFRPTPFVSTASTQTQLAAALHPTKPWLITGL